MKNFAAAYEDAKTQLEGISFSSSKINKSFKTTPGCTFLLEDEVPQPQKTAVGKVAEPKAFKLDKRWRAFETSSPVYVRYINFKGENLSRLNVHIVGADGKPRSIAVTQYAGFAQCQVRDFCGGFHLSIKSGAARPSLTSIEVYGFSAGNFESIRKLLSAYYNSSQALKGALEQASVEVRSSEEVLEQNELKLASLQSGIESAEESSATLEAENKKLNAEIKELALTRASLAEKVESLEREKIAKENNCHQLSSQIDGLNEEVSEVSRELASLVNDRSLISDEFRDYVREGRRQSGVYIWLMIVPCLVILLCAVLLYSGSHDLLFGNYETSHDKLAALILRVPFAAVLGGIAYYSWTIANRFLNKIFEVESERLTLAKLLVIAKDTVFSTAEQVGVDKSEKFYLRTRLKIEMLKAHLSKDLGDKFAFEVSEKVRDRDLVGSRSTESDDEPEEPDARIV